MGHPYHACLSEATIPGIACLIPPTRSMLCLLQDLTFAGSEGERDEVSVAVEAMIHDGGASGVVLDDAESVSQFVCDDDFFDAVGLAVVGVDFDGGAGVARPGEAACVLVEFGSLDDDASVGVVASVDGESGVGVLAVELDGGFQGGSVGTGEAALNVDSGLHGRSGGSPSEDANEVDECHCDEVHMLILT